ncbi:hypothetical protein K3555_16875 [Leisingera sp. M527]|uniref:ECs_2282 family putative zinc-binding protein n=1 Tax=Leisingera sp. M527 TaxID=2867014 RepID=UPI0021A5A1EB|nr:hypothetical protein [Leisingera sp. M527]UWQ32213.1 hypothetical protein K3555_16875 [Leisingera sp. M527]
MKNDYSRSIAMLCPTCGSDEFSFDNDLTETERTYECTSCGMEFTHEDIMDQNQDTISRAVEGMKKEIVADIRKDFKKIFK